MASTPAIDMHTIYRQIEKLFMQCYKDETPHNIKPENAERYLLHLLATVDVIYELKNDVVVGFIIYQKFRNVLFAQDELYIHEWVIHPEFRKRRVGYLLYKRIMEIAKSLGCARLRGLIYNPEMIRVVKRQPQCRATALQFEKEV